MVNNVGLLLLITKKKLIFKNDWLLGGLELVGINGDLIVVNSDG